MNGWNIAPKTEECMDSDDEKSTTIMMSMMMVAPGTHSS
jgi:hypothetical protein